MTRKSTTINSNVPLCITEDGNAEALSFLERHGLKSPLLVTGPSIIKEGLTTTFFDLCEQSNIRLTIYKEGQIDPTNEDVMTACALFKSQKCDSIVALGGGSRIDLAKGIRLMATHQGPISSYYMDNGGVERINETKIPLVCVPTTAGSGSEVSRGAVIVDLETNRKRLIAGPGLPASVAILDPNFTISLPPSLTAQTGIDALSHAIETYVGKNYNPVAEALSISATKVILDNLQYACEDGSNLFARKEMLIGSSMAAMGFSKGLGVVHSLAHQLGPHSSVSHGTAIGIFLTNGMKFNQPVAKSLYAKLAYSIGISATSLSEEKASMSLIEKVEALIDNIGMTKNLSEVGVSREHFPNLAQKAILDHCHVTNPRPCNEQTMLNILESSH